MKHHNGILARLIAKGDSVIILIGSYALNSLGVSTGRTPSDIDFIGTLDDMKTFIAQEEIYGVSITGVYPINNGKKYVIHRSGLVPIEFELVEMNPSAKELFRLHNLGLVAGEYKYEQALPAEYDYKQALPVFIPNVNWQYTFKMSHRFAKSPHFLKTMEDIKHLRKLDVCIPKEATESGWLKMREEETYTLARPKLNQSKNDFFNKDSGVHYIYDHDSIHRAMSLDKVPAYTLYKKDVNEVQTSKELWDKLDFDHKLLGVIEEAYVLALERSQIPHRGNIAPLDSFKIALEKICTTITSGWFREFAYDNYDTVLSKYDPGYVEHFDYQLAKGIVQPSF